MKAVEDGYFDPDDLSGPAAKANERARSTKADGSFGDAWRLYHDSFDDNSEDVVNAIYTSFMKNFKYISPLNFNGTVRLFKDLGREDLTNAMIDAYVAGRDEPQSFFSVDAYLSSGEGIDPDVSAAFRAKWNSFPRSVDSRSIFLRLKDAWQNEELDVIAALAVDEYYNAIINAKGKDLRNIISGCLQFDRIVNATESMRTISRKATEALQKIGRTSPINARRVASYGIKFEVERPDAAGPSS
jgi:hypothetical protein